MKRKLLLLLFISACISLVAREYTVENLPMPRSQGNVYVTNPDGILSSAAVSVMDTTLYALEKQTGIQVLVAAVEQIEGGDCFDFAYRLGRHAGVGEKGRDNGLVILLVTSERCIQFVTGYGLEGDLPDALCKQIQQRYMNPELAEGNWDAGMVAGVQAVRGILDGSMERQPSAGNEEDDMLILMIFISCFVLAPAALWYSVRQRNRCPQCHKHTLRQLSVRTVSRENGIRTEEVVYRCTNCGHIKRQQRKSRDNDNHHHPGGWGGPFMGGPFFGGGGGHGGGGGFSGGSFGGGDFGGGGTGSRF